MKHNCKIKDSSLNFELKTVELTRINKLSRTMVLIKQRLKTLINVPQRVKVIKLSNHIAGAGKKDLESNTITEIRYYKNKQTVKVKADIQQRFLNTI
jgi:hypothetical protein